MPSGINPGVVNVDAVLLACGDVFTAAVEADALRLDPVPGLAAVAASVIEIVVGGHIGAVEPGGGGKLVVPGQDTLAVVGAEGVDEMEVYPGFVRQKRRHIAPEGRIVGFGLDPDAVEASAVVFVGKSGNVAATAGGKVGVLICHSVALVRKTGPTST